MKIYCDFVGTLHQRRETYKYDFITFIRCITFKMMSFNWITYLWIKVLINQNNNKMVDNVLTMYYISYRFCI